MRPKRVDCDAMDIRLIEVFKHPMVLSDPGGITQREPFDLSIEPNTLLLTGFATGLLQ